MTAIRTRVLQMNPPLDCGVKLPDSRIKRAETSHDEIV